jgi:hemoglobin
MSADQDQAATAESQPQATLYERLGGAAGVAVLIDRFYDKVVSDPELAPFFRRTTLEKLRAMQREFFAAALDGPQSYSGLSLAAAHSGRGITPHHFSRYVGCLLETLTEIGVAPRDIRAVVDRIATYADDITGGTAEAG